MTQELLMTRSVLNPVAPIGVGTPEVESLVSYFCRLAMSHCISTYNLGRRVVDASNWEFSDRYVWISANLSGMSDATEKWARALSILTSVGNLERLTMLPWRHVIAQSSPRPTSSRWCPHCLAEDRAAGATPYFRLAWDIGTVTTCSKHKIRLVHVCPDCGGTDVRHKSSFVVPGWCTSCGCFLGENCNAETGTPAEIWIASQVGAMLSVQNTLPSIGAREVLIEGIRVLVQRLDDGKSAMFARRIGLGKATVHHWLKGDGIPTLPALLRIVSQTGLTLPDLLIGNLANWTPASAEIYELNALFPEVEKRAQGRRHDWRQIRATLAASAELPSVTSIKDAARSLNIHERDLYRHAKKETDAITERRKQQVQRRNEQNLIETRELIERVYPEIVAEGKAVNLREILAHAPEESSIKVRNLFDLLRNMKERS
ncbi:TetR family transcriptional regulator [Caballeronia novacaledonica]|uniref:TetR family transcriptional regulator n=1 Tax=Caballeronia novacaledonica TaxID=1544861 RepID=A0A2U3I3P4_9BURK|nr:TniQ family protein [Caballeronia novacaledonica]SPB14768.1 TetR family transcriptional regulator [Caballeronia novacaledonica]